MCSRRAGFSVKYENFRWKAMIMYFSIHSFYCFCFIGLKMLITNHRKYLPTPASPKLHYFNRQTFLGFGFSLAMRYAPVWMLFWKKANQSILDQPKFAWELLKAACLMSFLMFLASHQTGNAMETTLVAVQLLAPHLRSKEKKHGKLIVEEKKYLKLNKGSSVALSKL